MRIVMGKRAVQEVLKHKPEALHVIFAAKGFSDGIIDEIKNTNTPLKFVSKTKLFYMTGSENHGSIIAEVHEEKPIKLDRFLKENSYKKELKILALDQLFDPQNVGAVIRSAECFGVDLVIIPKKKGCGITPVVSKASSGASELVPIYFGSIVDAIEKCKEQGISCFAAEKKEHSIAVKEIMFPKKMLLVMGSEGEGIRKTISEKCEQSVFIPLKGKIDSLNVSQATAILLSTICA